MLPTDFPFDPTAVRDISGVKSVLETQGLHATLRVLNARTPHRFTGIYRYDGEFLRNIMLFDQHNPELLRGDDAPIATTYCALVPQCGGSLDVEDARRDPRTAVRSTTTPVVSYCGVLLRDADGTPFGTLCHFDLLPCQQRTSDIEWLQLLSPMLARAAMRQMAAVNSS